MGGRPGARPALNVDSVVVMRVRVDAEKCQGHNRCFARAPELFDVDDLGNAHELDDGVVPPELVEEAQLAVKNCPERAISISED